jgi:hypothetical protein
MKNPRKTHAPAPHMTLWVPTLIAGALSLAFLIALALYR